MHAERSLVNEAFVLWGMAHNHNDTLKKEIIENTINKKYSDATYKKFMKRTTAYAEKH